MRSRAASSLRLSASSTSRGAATPAVVVGRGGGGGVAALRLEGSLLQGGGKLFSRRAGIST